MLVCGMRSTGTRISKERLFPVEDPISVPRPQSLGYMSLPPSGLIKSDKFIVA